MGWLLPFIFGWWGTHWWNSHRWLGDVVDKPPPGGDPRLGFGLLVGVAGGLAALGIGRLAPGMAEPMPGIVAALAAGAVVGHIVRVLDGMMRKA